MAAREDAVPDGSLHSAEDRLMGLFEGGEGKDMLDMTEEGREPDFGARDVAGTAEVEGDEENAATQPEDADDAAPEEPDTEAEEDEDEDEGAEPDDTSDLTYEMPEGLEVRDSDDGQVFGMEIDGEFRPLSDLRDSYFRTRDYSQKTEELAHMRRTTSELQAELAEARQQYTERLLPEADDAARAVLATLKPDEKLKETDREAYYAQKDAYEDAERRYEEFREHRQAESQKRLGDLNALRTEAAAECERRLREAVPSWSDESVMAEEVSDLVDYVTSTYNVTPEERAQTLDWRSWDMARKAMLYDKAHSEKESAKSKPAKKKAPTLKAGRPTTTAEKKAKKDRGVRQARKRLRETGSVKHAQSAIEEILAQKAG